LSLFVGVVQGFAAGEPAFNIVPVTDRLLAQVLAEINNTAASHIGEVAQSLVGILQVNSNLLDLMEQEHEV
jgi:hypothetical protein